MAKAIRLGTIFFDFKANDKEFKKTFNNARRQIDKFSRQVNRMNRAALRMGRNIGLVASGIGLFGKRISAGTDELGKLSISLRTSIADMQILERQAQLAGLSFTQIQSGLRKLETTLGQIADGTS